MCRLSSVVEQRFCKPLVGSSNLSAGTGPYGSIPDTSVCTYETGTHNAGVEGSSSAPAPAQDAHRIAKQALGTSRAWDDDRLGFLQEHADC